MALTGFICHDSYLSKISKLTDEEVGRLFRALMTYHSTGEIVDVDGRESIAFDFIKDDIDRADEKYKEKCETNRRNRLMASVNEGQQTLTNVNEREQPSTNVLNNKNKNKNRNKENNRFIPPTPEQVAEYCRERGNNVNADRFCAFYASKGWKVGNQPMKDWKAAVITWEKRDAAAPAKPVVAQQYDQRDYTGVNDEMRSQTDELMKQFMSERGAG